MCVRPSYLSYSGHYRTSLKSWKINNSGGYERGERDRWEKPGGVEIEGGEDSDGLKTGRKSRVNEMKRQAGGDSVPKQQQMKCEEDL